MNILYGQSAESSVHNLTKEQQITRLEEVFAQVFAQEPECFTLGQIIWCKNPQLSNLRCSENPRLFLGALNQRIDATSLVKCAAELTSIAASLTVDCRVGVIDEDGELSVLLSDSRWYTAIAPRSR